MPAYHLVKDEHMGITLVNIGVGPSNAKTITDHVAVLRPHCWLMIGHCGGLRHSQRLGDYVLAHAYARLDHVLDNDLPLEVPIPPIAEVQVALADAVQQVTGVEPSELKSAPAHRYRGHHRRPGLGAALHGTGDFLQSVARHCRRYGISHHRHQWVPAARALWHVALRFRQAPARRNQTTRHGQRPFTAPGSAST